jgi:DNA polymerase III alpha subunit
MECNTDIDIDVPNREKALEHLKYISATISNRTNKHPSGVYFQNIPIHPIDGMAIFDHNEASEKGFFKIDFLKNSIYEGIEDEEHLDRLVNTEPVWELFQNQNIVSQLAQISEHHSLLVKFKPKSIEDLAVCLALMRPGKAHLQNKPYVKIIEEIWKPSKHYYYKKSHSIAYALSIVVQLNLLVEQICSDE